MSYTQGPCERDRPALLLSAAAGSNAGESYRRCLIDAVPGVGDRAAF